MAGLRRNRDLTVADYEKVGVAALDTFEKVALDLEVASLGLAEQHQIMQNQVEALQIQQAAVKESQAKFSKAALKVRALIS